MGVFETRARQSGERIRVEEEGIAEAVSNCRKGLFSPDEGEYGLSELLHYLGHNPENEIQPFDPDMLSLLGHDHGVADPANTVVSWIEKAASSSENTP